MRLPGVGCSLTLALASLAEGGFMPKISATATTDEAVVQLATRVPRELLQRIRILCVQREQTVMDFVAEAIREKLKRATVRVVPLAMSAAELLAGA